MTQIQDTQAPSAQLNPGALPAPLQGGLNWLGQNIVRPIQQRLQTIEQTPQFQQMQQSPLGQAVQGKFSNIIPSAIQEGKDIMSGKYKPQLMFGGEMEETPGLGLGEPEIGVPPEEANMTNAKRNIQLNGKDIKTQDDINKINDTWNIYGGTGTAHEQVNKVFGDQGALSKLGKQAQTVINAEGGTTSSSDIENSVLDNLNKNTNAQEIGAKNMKTAAQQYLDDVYTRAMDGKVIPITTKVPGTDKFIPSSQWQELPRGVSEISSEGGFERWEDPNTGKTWVRWDNPPKEAIPLKSQTITRMMPDQVDDSIMLKMKTIINGDANKTYTKDPTAWTTNEKIARYSRDGLDDLIDTKHPNVADINSHMSNMYKGYDDMMNNANKESAAQQKAANTPPPPPTPKWYSPGGLFKIGAGVAGIGLGAKEFGINPIQLAGQGLALGKEGLQAIGGMMSKPSQKDQQDNIPQQPGASLNQSSIHTSTQVPQSMQDVNTNEQLPAPSQITGPDGKPLAISPQDFRNQKAQVDAQVANLQQLGVPVPQSLLQQQKYLNQSDPNASGSLTNVYQRNSTAYGAAQNAVQLLNTVSPDFFNQFKNYDDLQKNTDPQYAALKTAFSILYSYNPKATDNLFTAGSKDVAQSELKQAMQQIGYDYFQTINSFTQNAPTGLPQTPPAQPSPQGVAQVAPQMTAPGLPSRPSTGIAGGLPSFQYSGGQWNQQ